MLSDNNSNDSSDPGRLLMDVTSQEALDIVEDAAADKGGTVLVGLPREELSLQNHHNQLPQQQPNQAPHQQQHNQQSIDSGRETPDSMKSVDQQTDPATTHLWQVLARNNGNSGQAQQLLQHIFTAQSLVHSYSMGGGGGGGGGAGNTMSLAKVGTRLHHSISVDRHIIMVYCLCFAIKKW